MLTFYLEGMIQKNEIISRNNLIYISFELLNDKNLNTIKQFESMF